jgi:hypothetical protein
MHWWQWLSVNRYNRGELADDVIFIEWANDYRHYLDLHQELDEFLQP